MIECTFFCLSKIGGRVYTLLNRLFAFYNQYYSIGAESIGCTSSLILERWRLSVHSSEPLFAIDKLKQTNIISIGDELIGCTSF